MNGFEKHGLTHTSPSQINMYSSAPCAWAAKYLAKRKFRYSNAAKAGVYIEDAVAKVLCNDISLEDAVFQAKERYSKEISLGGTPADINRGEAIEGMITQAVESLSEYGKPDFVKSIAKKYQQHKIELICNGDNWRLPIIGYVDFLYPDQNLIVDLKTTMRMPSEMSYEHFLQGVIYKKASGMDVRFLYVTGKKSKFFDIDGGEKVLADIKSILNRQEKYLRHDKETILATVPVNINTFYWSGDEETRKELYGL